MDTGVYKRSAGTARARCLAIQRGQFEVLSEYIMFTKTIWTPCIGEKEAQESNQHHNHAVAVMRSSDSAVVGHMPYLYRGTSSRMGAQ